MKTLGGRKGLGDFALRDATSWISLKLESDAARMQGTGKGRSSPADSKLDFSKKKLILQVQDGFFFTMSSPGQLSNNKNRPEIALP